MTQNKDSEKKIARKIERFFNENVLSELFDVAEIESSEKLLRELLDSYEDVHLVLSRELGDEDYNRTYPDCSTIMQRIDTWLKNSRAESRKRKQDLVQSGIEKLRIEEEFFRSRIARDLASLDAEQAEFVEDFERHIFSAKELMQTYSSVFLRVKEQGQALEDELQDTYDSQMKTLEDFIQTRRETIKKMKCAEIDVENKRKDSEELKMSEEKKSREKEAVLICKNIFDNICGRMAKLESKCKVDASILTDLQLMESKKEFKFIDSEYTGILDKILKLSEAKPSRYHETEKFSDIILDRKSKLGSIIDVYQSNLESEISKRDLTEDKIKNASTLGIKLPKFKGYDSKLDYYTFRSEFEKLVAPRISSNLQSDYLKHNYLEGQALELVKEIDDLSQIWERLKSSFGNVSTLLTTKIHSIEATTPLWKVKGDDKIVESIIKIKNLMMELSAMSEKHSVEQNLYHTSNISKVFNTLGRNRQLEFTKDVVDDSSEKSEKEIWNELIKFLDKELRVKEKVMLFRKSNPSDGSGKSRDDDPSGGKHHPALALQLDANLECCLCGKTDHVPTITRKGSKIICYHACPTFALMNVKDRFNLLKSKHLCFQCMSPGFKYGHKGRCFDAFKCPDPSHNRHKSGIHVLLCDTHKGNPANLQLLEKYKAKCIADNPNFLDFTKNISIAMHVNDVSSFKSSDEPEDADDAAIFMFQRIAVCQFEFNIFYDGGCSDMVISKRALDILISLSRAKLILKGPLLLKGVGDVESVCPYGRFEISLPLHNGKEAKLTGICLDKVTGTFDPVSLKAAENDLRQNYDGNPEDLPRLFEFVGGDTDIMIGIKNNKYFPMELFRMDSGFAIYESQFKSVDGSRGIAAGPHKSFNRTDGSVNHVYLTEAAMIYCQMHQLGLDVGLLGSRVGFNYVTDDEERGDSNSAYEETPDSVVTTHFCNEHYVATPGCLRKFEMIENAGTEASYRCVRCRGCEVCKKSAQIEYISIQEELEQSVIEKSVTVNPENNSSEAYLPFLCNPAKKLVDNYGRAKKFYEGQVKVLNTKPDDKEQIITAMKKLFTLGFAAKVDCLSEQQRKLISDSPIRYFLPWFANFSKNSKTTPCRPVFNGSSPTASGYSLNDLLPKGQNNLNNLVQIFIRWLTYACAFCTDIQKMYNTIKLAEKHWCFQLFLWDDELNPSNEPEICVITTLIYGVKPSGNQAGHALRVTADLHRVEYPLPNRMIKEDTYVDDCGSGVTVLRGGGVDVSASIEEAKSVTDDLQVVLNKGGFQLKGVTFSGCDPPEHLCDEDMSVTFGGIKWFPKTDLLSLSIDDLNFGKKFHGKVSEDSIGIIPSRLTRRQCASRTGEIFDFSGRFAPLIAQFKLDLHELCTYKLQWNDYIPDELFQKWKSNFDTMEKMREIKFQRCIIPTDAVSLNIDTLEMGDSSAKMACSAIYVRYLKKDGFYSCQLVFARTKIIPSDMSLPRAELFAATLNATTGHVVITALGNRVVDRTSLIDNQVALFWISSTYAKLKQWVRSKVVEVNRLTNKEDWYYIDTKDNTADLGTRRGAKVSDVLDGSAWVQGHAWASLDKASFPVKSVRQLKLCSEDVKNFNDELIDPNITDNDWISKQLNVECHHSVYVTSEREKLDEVALRYKFSKYIVDPNKFSFRKIVRIVGLILMFIWKCKKRVGKSMPVISVKTLPDRFQFCNDRYLVTITNKFPFICKQGLVVELTEFYLLESLNYFFNKASAEIKHFLPESAYKKISSDRLGILYYTGRILPSQQFKAKVQLSDVCLDLSQSSFCVPMIERNSPLAYAFVNEIHWYDPDANHSGVETLWRYVLKNVYIMEGRTLVKNFKDQCTRCRYLKKKAIDVAMGPKSGDNLCIAPPFYNSQVDMFGPFSSYSNVNKRATSKIWFVIFCCCVTGAVDVKVAEDYTTESFILAFLRFSCKVGFPRKLLPDAGSQLIKGCENVVLSFYDIHNKLGEFGAEFEQCPVGAHYMHGKVERKIKDVKITFSKHLQNHRLSIIQWETLGCQVANTLNNLPIGIGNVARDLEHLDLITPNRLLLGRNNSRCPSEKMIITQNLGKIIEQNDKIFEAWFRAWLTSCVPNLMIHPKWFKSDIDPQVGDIILFLKSDKEFQKLYQYGMITFCKRSRDGKIREVEIEYQNHMDKSKRHTTRGTKEIVVIHPYEELGLVRQLNIMAINAV